MVGNSIAAFGVGDLTTPSTRYRLLLLRPFLDLAGLDVAVHVPRTGGRRLGEVFGAVAGLLGADLVLVQKRLISPFFLSLAAVRRIPVVFDLDDAIFVGDQSAKTPHERDRQRLLRIMNQATLVIAGNQYLGDWASGLGAKVKVIPTAVDTVLWNPGVRRRHDGVVLGWIGTSANTTYLESIADIIVTLLDEKPELRLVVVCDRPPRFKHPSIEFRVWSLSSELESVADFDIGLMPLDDDDWTRGKCAFKALQYMSLGIPAVASAVGANVEVIQHGVTGVLVKRHDGWNAALRRLIGDAALRCEIGAHARESVVADYSLERAGRSLAEALRDVLDGEIR